MIWEPYGIYFRRLGGALVTTKSGVDKGQNNAEFSTSRRYDFASCISIYHGVHGVKIEQNK